MSSTGRLSSAGLKVVTAYTQIFVDDANNNLDFVVGGTSSPNRIVATTHNSGMSIFVTISKVKDLVQLLPEKQAIPLQSLGVLGTAAEGAGNAHNLWDECTNPLLAQIDRFVLFSDLHVSDATLPTCLDALKLVQQTCKRHGSPVGTSKQENLTAANARRGKDTSKLQDTPAVAVFLGDFWHSRIERHLHWGLLRPIFEFWEQWDVPVVLLPGNHDQLSYKAGRDLLEPLERASSRSPLVLALRRPTLINKELLFLPHIRETSQLQRIMAKAKQCKTLRAVFGHLSVRGATISPLSEEGGAILDDGIDIDLLPDVHVYSGHIHTPQLVGKQVRYVGSLYQTSLAEAYQRKSIYTISRSRGFDLVDVQESAVGPRHFPVEDPRLLPPPGTLRRGDRVVLLPSTQAAPDLPCSKSAVSSLLPDGYGGQLPTEDTDGTAEPIRKLSGSSASLQLSRHKITSGCDDATSRCTGSSSTTVETGGGPGTAYNTPPVNRLNALNAEQLFQISEAYREAGKTVPAGVRGYWKQLNVALPELCNSVASRALVRVCNHHARLQSVMFAGILFDCRINPIPSASWPLQQVPFNVDKEQQQSLTTPSIGVPGMANPATAHARSASGGFSDAAEEQTTKTTLNGSDYFGHLLPDARTSPFRLLMHHGLLPLENRPPREALRVYADHVVKDGSQTFSKQALAAADMILQELLEGGCLDGVESSCKAAHTSTATNTGLPHSAADLVLHHACIQSFGPYSGVVRFDLRQRGLVLVQGNKDTTARGRLVTTNGAGKSTVMQAVLWALVGDALCSGFTTAAGKPKVTGVVCDEMPVIPSSSGAAADSNPSDRGNVEEPLSLCPGTEDRFASVKLEELTLQVGGRDMTAQSAADTQREALLTLLLPLDVWIGATGVVRSKQRTLSKAAEALDLVAAVRSQKAVLEEVEQHLGPQGIQRHLLAERTIQQASSGQRQLLGLCLYLAFVVTLKRRTGLRCNVLFLDEPFLSLDCVNKQHVLELLRSLAGEPRGSQLAEFESIFLTHSGPRPRTWRHILDAVDTIAIQSKSGHRNISTSVFVRHSKKGCS
ncbi:hypothetical protein, conserved [Eimeria brunetti]|uniref:Uncharacterized protein n=1 Tax=Eimeria brunetti TaxID=51314 RepID=U6LWZ8_9EIME|nr:hypothetical protein, conserved [Eimeria brunetti]